ncbi:MAG: Type 1 glutamine amidotransferase-like domain-containing protein [Chryseobacterium sp.]|uniref:Type 1 glutamine amidotransferase-like domain-containing protein n=1 Tax=Chryseobacterium sp. TaxID=1871047 RepID=UPI001AFEA446|nr:Type 1 glutamine amidotransferase-like domain-containing protein [Chryseobacterium sp.]MBO6183616.1 Type 1 glutamine amidotransferase-like domain-containing protein [Chryseobacterium sp.]
MKFYLSSYKFGNDYTQILNMLPKGAKIGHINNSRDWLGVNEENKQKALKDEMEFLEILGFQCEHLDLKEYFGREKDLKIKLDSLKGIWVCGGNTFVLRQAMRLSGFDNIFKDLQKDENFFWGGYSAGICILCDSLKYIDYVDDANNFPYIGITEPIYEGLGIFDYALLPHYKSDHEESEMIDKEVERCINNKWLFKALKDGEIIIKNS